MLDSVAAFCVLFRHALIALDEKLGLNNGLPAFWAFLLDRLDVALGESVIHLGCGTGYYTAILAELVGPAGKVRALDIHPEMAATILVLPNRRHTQIAADGSYAIDGVPPGTWTVFAYTRRATKPVSEE